MGSTRRGAAAGLTAAILWGSQYPIAKAVYRTLDPFTLTAVRYVLASACFLALLAAREGVTALRFDGRLPAAALLGAVGLTGGVLFPFVGLRATTTVSAALVAALQPLMAATVLALRARQWIDRRTAIAITLALAGVALLLTKGDPGAITDGSIGWGVILVAAGQFGWIAYTIGGAWFPAWSTIRFTALTVAPGTVALVIALAVATAAGWADPSLPAITSRPGLLAYLVLGPGVAAVLLWNAGRRRIGPGAVALFQNAVPITAFAIVIGQGYRPSFAEAAGAALTVAALTWFAAVRDRSLV